MKGNKKVNPADKKKIEVGKKANPKIANPKVSEASAKCLYKKKIPAISADHYVGR